MKDKPKNKGRNGKHKPSKIRIQISVDRDIKAILVYTASIVGVTLTDLLIGEGLRVARLRGIIDENYHVNREHINGVELIKAMLETQKGDL